MWQQQRSFFSHLSNPEHLAHEVRQIPLHHNHGVALREQRGLHNQKTQNPWHMYTTKTHTHDGENEGKSAAIVSGLHLCNQWAIKRGSTCKRWLQLILPQKKPISEFRCKRGVVTFGNTLHSSARARKLFAEES